MNPFFVVERFCAELVERSFGRVFPSRLEPVQIARRLTAALEATVPPPTMYRVVVHPGDYAELALEAADLAASWSRMLTEMARHLHLPLAETPQITLAASAEIPPGSVRVDAEPGLNVMRLRVMRGIPADFTLTITKAAIVGRAPESDLALFDPSVSRRHGRFVRHGETLEFEDLGSRNGTYVAERRVERVTLHRGDLIRLGDCELRVE